MSRETSGGYRRPRGSYVRPPACFVIEDRYRTVDHWPISAVHFHRSALQRFRGKDGAAVMVELVPEPGNRYDLTAVACDVDGVRVGYKAARAALRWHDIVRAANLDGFAVMTRGEVLSGDDEDDDVGISIPGQAWDDLVRMAIRFGLRDEFDSMVLALTEDEEAGLLRHDAHDPDPSVLRRLYERRASHPKHSWAPARTPYGDELTYFERMPFWMDYFLKQEAKKRREERNHRKWLEATAARAERERVKKEAAAQRAAETKRRKADRLDAGRRAVQMNAEGIAIAKIAADLGLTSSQVSTAMAAARKEGGVASDWHANVQDQRKEHAAEAVRLQRAGLTARQIAAHMDRSWESVRELLSDGNFSENPHSRPERLELARRCNALRREVKAKTEILGLLGVSRMLGLRAFRDAQVVE